MRKQREASVRPGQAALIVTYGNTTQKQHPLEGDLVVLGRAASCDISLVSPEVAPVHCILVRSSDGWHLRDCSGGRHATRLNGRPVRVEKLHDADVFQIGAFSFEIHLPFAQPTPLPGTTPVGDDQTAARMHYLQRSRRHLVSLALRLRRKARQANSLPPSLAELEQQAETLRGLQRDYQALIEDYESRLQDVEKAESEASEERATLEREFLERQTHLDNAERELARRQEEMEAQLKQRQDEFEQRCGQAEQRRSRFLQALPAADAAAPSQELAALLDRRSQELNHFARYLRRCRRQLARDRAILVAERSELLRFHEVIREVGNPAAGTARVGGRLDQLPALKQEIAGTSPSAPGEQIRDDSDDITVDLEHSSVG